MFNAKVPFTMLLHIPIHQTTCPPYTSLYTRLQVLPTHPYTPDYMPSLHIPIHQTTCPPYKSLYTRLHALPTHPYTPDYMPSLHIPIHQTTSPPHISLYTRLHDLSALSFLQHCYKLLKCSHQLCLRTHPMQSPP